SGMPRFCLSAAERRSSASTTRPARYQSVCTDVSLVTTNSESVATRARKIDMIESMFGFQLGARRAKSSACFCTGSRSEDAGSEIFGKARSEEHTSELQSPCNLVCRLLLEKKT